MGYHRKEGDRKRGKAPVAVKYHTEFVEGYEDYGACEDIVVTEDEAVNAGLSYKMPTKAVRTIFGVYHYPVNINANGSHLVVARLPAWREERTRTIRTEYWLHPNGNIRPYRSDGHSLGYGLRKANALRNAELSSIAEDLDGPEAMDFDELFPYRREPITIWKLHSIYTGEVTVRVVGDCACCQLV